MPKGCIPIDALRNLLREQGYKYRRQGDRTTIWVRPGNPIPVNLPRTATTTETRARQILKYAGVEKQAVETFVVNYRSDK